MKVELKWITPNAEKEIVEIARVSSSREKKDENPEKLLSYLIKNRHWSPFEMANMCISIHTSRAIGRQILRHRSFTFQEFSQRYAVATEFEPIELREQAVKNRQSSSLVFDPLIGGGNKISHIPASKRINSILDKINELYGLLIENGVAKECARMILPGCTSTHLYMNGTIRSWIHFLQIRDDSHAQKESQNIAQEIKKILKNEMPVVFNLMTNL